MRQLWVMALLALASTASYSAEPAKAADPRAEIAKKVPGAKIEDVRPSPVKGIYEVRMGSESAYVTADARFIFSGDLYDLDSKENLTEQGRVGERRSALAKLDEKEMIIFSPDKTDHTITVFTVVVFG